MAKLEVLAPMVAKWEGGLSNDKVDKGGITNLGITLSTWRAVGYDKDSDLDIDGDDIKLLTKDDFKAVLKKYWDRWQGDNIISQSVANILVDWYWNSGKWGIVIPQRLLGLVDDGQVGSKTIAAVNAQNQKEFFNRVYSEREAFFHRICDASLKAFEKKKGKPATEKEKNTKTNYKFLTGWLNRLSDFKYL